MTCNESLENKQDYVICWFKKAADYIADSTKDVKVAFVATNSICQGESVPTFWKNMIARGIDINFARRSFIWDSEANEKAHVHCVIVGYSMKMGIQSDKFIFDNETRVKVEHINPYLMEAPDIWLINRKNENIYNLPKMTTGNPPTDDGGLLLTQEEREYFINNYPQLRQYIRPFVGSKEFLNDKIGTFSRYCFWFVNANPSDLGKNPDIKKRLEKVRNLRKNSSADRIQKRAIVPYLFCQIRQPDTNYLIIPETSSERREYIPMGFMEPEVICSNAVKFIPNASFYVFGVMTSKIHMAWTKVVCGRLKSDYRYSPAIYNNFPWPTPTSEQKEKIESSAKEILDSRALYPKSSLAGLYDPLLMPVELRKAHNKNDKMVAAAYGFEDELSDEEYAEKLMVLFNEKNKDTLVSNDAL